MSLGSAIRGVLGRELSHRVGHYYRAFFVDLEKVAQALSASIPPDARVLDVGGGDGYVVDLLLTKRPDIRVTMTDIAPEIGSFIRAANRDRVTLMPGTDVGTVEGRFDVITVADVVHHVPAVHRPAFFDTLSVVAHRTGAKTVLVKDIEPGNLRALLSLWGDLYITCDKGVSLVESEAVGIPGFERAETTMPDFPNYCVTFAAKAA